MTTDEDFELVGAAARVHGGLEALSRLKVRLNDAEVRATIWQGHAETWAKEAEASARRVSELEAEYWDYGTQAEARIAELEAENERLNEQAENEGLRQSDLGEAHHRRPHPPTPDRGSGEGVGGHRV